MSSVAEPKPRKDGCCIVCRKPIKTVTRYGAADAFDSAACCKSYFGAQHLSGPPHPDNQPPQEG